MENNLNADFEKADRILSEALQTFQKEKVNQYVWAMALVEIGVSALVRIDEDGGSIMKTVEQFMKTAASKQ